MYAYQVMLTFHGLISPHLFWVHGSLFRLCVYQLYDFPKYVFGMFTSDSYLQNNFKRNDLREQ